MKPLKIAQIVGDSSNSGAPRHVFLLSKALLKRGHNLLVVTPPGPLAERLKRAKINIAQVKMKSPLDRTADHKIREVLQQYHPDVVHCHGTRGGWLGRLAARKLKQIAVVYTEHLWTKGYHLSNPVWEQFQIRGLGYMDKFTARTIAVSEAVKRFLVKRQIVPERKIVVIPNLLDQRFTSVKKYSKPTNLPVLIGTVGSLNAQKGHAMLIEALSALKKADKKLNWQCQIVGTGPLEKYLKRLIRKRKLRSRVSIFTDVSDAREAMRHFSIYVQFSRTESFGMAVAEAMALGVPVIVSNKGALPEMVRDGHTGVVVPFGKTEMLATAIGRLIQKDTLRQKFGDAGRKKALSQFNQNTIVGQIEQVYSGALRDR